MPSYLQMLCSAVVFSCLFWVLFFSNINIRRIMIFHFWQDCCLIPESPFYLDGEGGLLQYIEKRLKENKHMVIVVAEGAGQDLIAKSIAKSDQQDASGNKLLLDIGLWLTHKIKVHNQNISCCWIWAKSLYLAILVFTVSDNAKKLSNSTICGSCKFWLINLVLIPRRITSKAKRWRWRLNT